MLILFLIPLCLETVHSIICSKSPPIHHKFTLARDRVTAKETPQTLVTISLGLKETACFSLRNEKFWEKEDEVYGISLDYVKSQLNYKNSYTFGIPKPEVKCICDCPGAEDFCNANTDSCKESKYVPQMTCYNWYKDNLATPGCTAFLSGSSQVCCSITVSPANDTIWRAIELEKSVNRALFTVTNLRTQHSKATEVDIEGGHPILEPFYLTINAPSIESSLYPGWYFGPLSGGKLFGGVQINGLSEYDIEKLGWYKYSKGEYEMDENQVMESLNVDVDNCDKDELNVQFNNGYSDDPFDKMNELNNLYRTSLENIVRMDSERRIEAYFRQYSNIDITIKLDGDYNVVQVFDTSHFKDFDGAVMMDKHSNYFINVTIHEGKGSIRGNLTVNDKDDSSEENSDVFKINVDQHHEVDSVYYIRVSAICKDNQKAMLCLFTDSGPETLRCKSVLCDRKPLQEFELPDSSIDYEKGEKMSIFSPSTWAKHLNPMEWFNGISNWKEAVIMATEIVGILTVIGIVLKVLKMLGILQKCCKCLWCWEPKKKGNTSKSSYHSEKDRKRLIGELMDQFSNHGGSTIHLNRSYRHRSHSSDSAASFMVATPKYYDVEEQQFQYPPEQHDRIIYPASEQPQVFTNERSHDRGHIMPSCQKLSSNIPGCNNISNCNNMATCQNIASSCNNISSPNNIINSNIPSSSHNMPSIHNMSSGHDMSSSHNMIMSNGYNMSSGQNMSNSHIMLSSNNISGSRNMLNFSNMPNLGNPSNCSTLNKPRAPPPVPARTRTLPVGAPLPGFSTPGSFRDRKSSTLPNKFNPTMTPPPTRVGTVNRIFDRNGRRHTVQHAAGSPSLARVFVRPQHLCDQEMEVFNSTDSLLSRGGERDVNRETVFRKGHSRNGSRVLLLKNSSDV